MSAKSKTKTLGHLLCVAFGANWNEVGFAAQRDFQEAAVDFLKSLHKSTELTSPAVASKAAKLLRSPKASKAVKSVAGSALTQKS